MQIITIAVSIILQAFIFFMPGQEIVNEKHGCIHDQHNKPGRHQEKAESTHCQWRILRMANEVVNTAGYRPFLELDKKGDFKFKQSRNRLIQAVFMNGGYRDAAQKARW